MPDFIVAFWLALLASMNSAPPPDMTQAGPKPGVSTPSETAPAEAAGPVRCQVEVEGSPSHRTITALASAQVRQSGTFALEIEKTGANTARSRQRGDFALTPGETKRLAVVKMNLAPHEALAGRLSLNWDGGETACTMK